MNLSREQIQVIESLGFTLNETNNYQKEGDWQTLSYHKRLYVFYRSSTNFN